jgi:hypothetical protein
MRVVSDRAKAPPAAMRIKRSAMTLCASNASMAVCDDTENQLFQIRNRLLIVPFPIRRHIRRARFLPDNEINRWEALQNGHRNCS